jgi:hypothetical protein
MKKVLLLFAVVTLSISFFSCSSDDDNMEEQLFLANHEGNWETTFNDLGVNVAVEITPTSLKPFTKLISTSCYKSVNNSIPGTFIVDTHSASEYTAVIRNILVSDVFTGSDLQLLLDIGITKIDIAFSYQSSGGNSIAFSEIYYKTGTLDEILSADGLLGKINTIVKC